MLIFVKLGGSVLTDKTQVEALNLPTLRATVAVLADVRRDQPEMRLLVGHGAGSYGHYWADKYRTQAGVSTAEDWYGVARIADAMGRLNRAVAAEFLAASIAAIGVQPSATAQATARQLTQFDTRTIRGLLDAGVVPVVHGDVVLDSVQGASIISTEGIFAYLAPRLAPQRIVLVGEAGVYTADPRRDPRATRIPEITAHNIAAVRQQTGASHGTDVTGGMAAKVDQMWALVQAVPGLEVQIVGTDPVVLKRALRGEPIGEGTIIR